MPYTQTFIIVFTITILFWVSVLILSVILKVLYTVMSSEYFQKLILFLSPIILIKMTKKVVQINQSIHRCSVHNYNYILEKPDVNASEYVKINKTRSYHDYSDDEDSYEKTGTNIKFLEI